MMLAQPSCGTLMTSSEAQFKAIVIALMLLYDLISQKGFFGANNNATAVRQMNTYE